MKHQVYWAIIEEGWRVAMDDDAASSFENTTLMGNVSTKDAHYDQKRSNSSEDKWLT